ncbi:glycosyltransferase family 39 protein [Streptomyces sp. TRM66268-LWL]|uniref:Glycosyltransferase family 39 protein n=1 Tax=Streptomyces polyasparticus TaxID=2767826 RepID=A0ABR7SUF4_9ACTN|nr:glycosyltransferase family 39 protein [Streptomyces polyasparticus]MBC9718166.1 glycosyltransferase family 39 protein [Streptomyces polyasparticus]
MKARSGFLLGRLAPPSLGARRFALPFVVPLVFVLLHLTVATPPTVWRDTTRYARAAEQHLGIDRATAQHDVVALLCAAQADVAAREARLSPVPPDPGTVRGTQEQECLQRYAGARDITTDDHRYQSIFASRWGYPWLLAPFVGVFGLGAGLRACALLIAAACVLLVYPVLRAAGAGRRAPVAGQVALAASPLGWWAVQPLTEGPVLACVLGALWGVVRLVRGQGARATSAAVIGLALGGCFLLRYSSALLLAGALAVAAAATAVRRRRRRATGTAGTTETTGTAGAWHAAAVTGAAAVAMAAAIAVLRLPTAEITLQDTFTVHFRRPPVPDPWARLWDLNVELWRHWWGEQAARPYFLALTALASWALLRRAPSLAVPAAACALVGVAQVAGHPLLSEADRLGALMWLPVVLGLPLLPAAWAARATPSQVPVQEQRSASAPLSVR